MPKIVQRNTALFVAFFLLVCVEAYAASPPSPSYSLTDLGVLPGFRQTLGHSINALGEVAGSCSTYASSGTTSQHAFVYRRGKLIDFGALYNPALITSASFVNSEGDVILTYGVPIPPYYTADRNYSVLYRNRRFTTLPNGGSLLVNGLNDRGQIAGNFILSNGGYDDFSATSAFLIEPNGTLLTLPTFGPLGNLGFIYVQGITQGGRVYGTVPTGAYSIYDAVIASAYGPPVNLKTSNDGTGSLVVNNVGDYVVIALILEPYDLPVLHVGAKTINLGLIPGTENGLEYYTPTGINDCDTVVGYALHQASNALTPFVYLHGAMYDPNTLITPTAPLVHLFQALGVNDAGQILAVGSTNGEPSTDGPPYHTFILNPCVR